MTNVNISRIINVMSTNNETKFSKLILSAAGTKIKNSPSYINKNSMISTQFILY